MDTVKAADKSKIHACVNGKAKSLLANRNPGVYRCNRHLPDDKDVTYICNVTM